jgi:putative endonuclease
MAGLVPAIHVCSAESLVDARHKAGHDEERAPHFDCHGRACPGHPRLTLFADAGRVRLLHDEQPNGILYTGVTSELLQRVHQHKTGAFPGFTRRYGLKRLVYFETHDDIRTAIQREKTIKHWSRAWKVRLILTTNPRWSDLYDSLV